MDVFSNQVYKNTAREDGKIAITFNKEIDVIEETLTRTFVQFGKLLKMDTPESLSRIINLCLLHI